MVKEVKVFNKNGFSCYVKPMYVESCPWGCDFGTSLFQCQKWLAEDQMTGMITYVKVETKIYDVRHGDISDSMCDPIDHSQELKTSVFLAIIIDYNLCVVIDNDLEIYGSESSTYDDIRTEIDALRRNQGFLRTLNSLCEDDEDDNRMISRLTESLMNKLLNSNDYFVNIFTDILSIDSDVVKCLYQMLRKLGVQIVDEDPSLQIQRKSKYGYKPHWSEDKCPDHWYDHYLRLGEGPGIGFEVSLGIYPYEIEEVDSSCSDEGICVYVESPYSGHSHEEWERNINYARYAMQDCLKRGESPFLSQLLYTQAPHVGFVEDSDEKHKLLGREKSVNLAFKWRSKANKTVVYTDFGITNGMKLGIKHAQDHENPIEYRTIPNIHQLLEKKTEGVRPAHESVGACSLNNIINGV